MPNYKHTITYTNGHAFKLKSHLECDVDGAEVIIRDHLEEIGDITDLIQEIQTVEVVDPEEEEIVWEDLFASPNRDPDTMTVGELFSPCPECNSDLSVDGGCRFCGGDPPTAQRIAARRAWLKAHPNEEREVE
jgi:hypothetical protein